MKQIDRVLAFVRFEPSAGGSREPWAWVVEGHDIDDFMHVLLAGHSKHAMSAMAVCGSVASEYGFGLDWHGFVAHGVPVETEKGAQPA